MKRILLALPLFLVLLNAGSIYAQKSTKGTSYNDELKRNYLMLHHIVWQNSENYDKEVYDLLAEIKKQLVENDNIEYMFFLEELGRFIDEGNSESFSDVIYEIFMKRGDIVFQYIFNKSVNHNYLMEMLFDELYFQIEVAKNPKMIYNQIISKIEEHHTSNRNKTSKSTKEFDEMYKKFRNKAEAVINE